MSDDDKVIPIGGINPLKSVSSEAIETMKKEMSNTIELMKIMATLQRVKYEALRGEGFSPEQAIELSKDVFGT